MRRLGWLSPVVHVIDFPQHFFNRVGIVEADISMSHYQHFQGLLRRAVGGLGVFEFTAHSKPVSFIKLDPLLG